MSNESQNQSTIYEALADKSREQIIDHWMEDKLFYQGQIKRLSEIIRQFHVAHLKSATLFEAASIDVVLDDEPHNQSTERSYAERCVTCRHDHWQNDAVGDCRIFHKDVLHDNVEPCSRYEGIRNEP